MQTNETTRVPHMSADEFRRRGSEIIELIAGYMEGGAEAYPVLSDAGPGQIASMLPPEAPATGESWDDILADIQRVVMPGLTHWQSPNFFGYFPCASSYPGILGDLLCTGLMVQGMQWQTSPACTEIETRVLDWLGRAIGLPDRFLHAPTQGAGGGVIQGTASEAVLVAMVAARRRAGDVEAQRACVFASDQSHSSVVKAARILGLPEENIRSVASDEKLAMDAPRLAAEMRGVAASGKCPMFVCATLGTTSTCAVDPIERIGPVADEHGAWLHVDAAYAGAALVCPEFRWMLQGVERAHSFNFNPHKWLLTNFDCSALWTSEAAHLVGSLAITPEYLRNRASDEHDVIDYRDWQVPLGRRFRALKLWFVLRHYGVEGLRAHIMHHVELARRFEAFVEADDAFEVCAQRRFALVCFRMRGSDEENRTLRDRLNASGSMFLTHAVVPVRGEDRFVLRFSVGAASVREEHINRAWDRISAEARDIRGA